MISRSRTSSAVSVLSSPVLSWNNFMSFLMFNTNMVYEIEFDLDPKWFRSPNSPMSSVRF